MKIYNIPSYFAPSKLNQQKSQSSNLSFCWTKPIYSPEMSCAQVTRITDEFLLPELSDNKITISSLCDLGCGDGSPTKILSDKLKTAPKNIVGVDNMPYVRPNFNEEQFEPNDFMVYLNKTNKNFDMISLCRPDCSYRLNNELSKLLTSIANHLTDKGYFFTYGENIFMDKITAICKEKGVSYKSKQYSWDNMRFDRLDDREYNLQAILISKSVLLKGFS